MDIEQMEFEQWLDELVEEKNLDLEQKLKIEHKGFLHLLPLQVVISGIKNLDAKYRSKVKIILTVIDFLNGDVMEFFNHLGKGYIAQNFKDVIGA